MGYLDSSGLSKKFIGLSDWLNWMRHVVSEFKTFADSFGLIPMTAPIIVEGQMSLNPTTMAVNDRHKK